MIQSSRLKPIFSLVSHNKEFARKVAVASTSSVTSSDNANLKSWREIPGPSSLPIIGILHHFLPGGTLANINQLEASQKMYDMYGPIIRLDGVVGQPPMVLLSDPESCGQVLRGENSVPIRPGFFSLEHYRKDVKQRKGHQVNATGLITDQGDAWKEFRSTVNPVMLQPKTIKLYNKVLDEVALDMIERMKSIRNDQNMIEGKFDVEMNLWALESIGTVALGCRLNCFDPNLAEDSPERQLIQCIHDLFETSNQLDFKPGVWRWFATPLYKKAMKLYEHQEQLTKHFIKKGMAQFKENKAKAEHEKGVLEKLLEINEEVALIMASDMLFAGVDTAANTITATLYLLATNQEKQEKLRAEILSRPERTPYLKACIKEGMRLMPIVSGNIRTTTKEYNLLGYKIPKGMNVVFSHRDMSLSEDQYPRAKEFIPERWMSSKDDPLYHRNSNPFATVPFGFGVRSCIGRRIAELEIETFLTRLIENFRVEWFGPPPKLVQSALTYVKEPFNFKFYDVKKE